MAGGRPGEVLARAVREFAAHRRADRVWQSVLDGIDRLLTGGKAEHVVIERADDPPQRGAGGKYRRLVPLSA